MKKSISFLMIASLFALGSCNGGSNSNQDSVDSANSMNDKKDTSGMMPSHDTAAMMTPVDKDAADFAVKVANGGMEEIALGKVAQENAASQRVKDFGAMMVKDHTDAGDKLKQIAAAKNITLPGEMGDDAQKDVDNLSKKKGKDFDKAYMNMMVDDHKKVVKMMQDASANCKDPDLKTFATETLPTIQVHLDSAKAISGKK